MKGLEISRRFFLEWARPLLARDVPELMDRIAVGLLGPNSQAFGYDDELSRDHAWGPFFCVWVPDDMDAVDLGRIESSLRTGAPESFLGFPLSAERKTPFNMPDFAVVRLSSALWFFTGSERGPGDDLDWLTIPEHRLCEATSGEIFHDPPELMASWRKKIAYYPDNVWLKRLSFAWVALASTAQMPRYVERRDAVGAQMCVSWFMEASMRLDFLLSRKYAPWRKWLFRMLTETRSEEAGLAPLIRELATERSLEKREECMLRALHILGTRANALGVIEAQPLRGRSTENSIDFNFEAFARAFHAKLRPPLAALPIDRGPVDWWGPLQVFAAPPPPFMGNRTFIRAIYKT